MLHHLLGGAQILITDYVYSTLLSRIIYYRPQSRDLLLIDNRGVFWETFIYVILLAEIHR